MEVAQDIVDAVDTFTLPLNFERKGSRDKSYMYLVAVCGAHGIWKRQPQVLLPDQLTLQEDLEGDPL